MPDGYPGVPIPVLFLTDGTEQVVSVGGNQDKVDAARLAAAPWIQRSNGTYSLIFEALPPIAVKLVQAETTAKALWDSLIQLYQNPTSYEANTLLQRLSSYKCKVDEGMV